MINGVEVKNFTDIPRETNLLVCCLNHNFKGVFDSAKLTTFQGSKVVKNENIKNCLFNKTYQWSRDKMLHWNEQNAKIEGPNKILDLTNHIEGVATSINPNNGVTKSPF